MREPKEIYSAFEREINDAIQLQEAIDELFRLRLSKPNALFVYRGAEDADFGFHSSLYRRLWWTRATQLGRKVVDTPPPTEAQLSAAEHEILVAAHRWGLHDAERGRLSVLRQLAILQHNHAPTRLIDVSFSLWVALWFAVQVSWDKGKELPDTKDGRIFIIDVRGRLINELDERVWEDALRRPWLADAGDKKNWMEDWTLRTRAWSPTPQDRRIAAQQGAFLLGGVPAGRLQYAASSRKDDWLTMRETRGYTSVPLRFHKFDPKTGGAIAGNAVYTWKIAAKAKSALRKRLQQISGLTTERMYPDVAGFGRFATPNLVDTFPG
jgi:hypothetical protein